MAGQLTRKILFYHRDDTFPRVFDKLLNHYCELACEILWVSEPKELIEVAIRERPHIIFVYLFPFLAFETHRLIDVTIPLRRHIALKNIPTVAFSNYTNDILPTVIEHGFQGHFRPGGRFQEFAECIDTVLGGGSYFSAENSFRSPLRPA